MAKAWNNMTDSERSEFMEQLDRDDLNNERRWKSHIVLCGVNIDGIIGVVLRTKNGKERPCRGYPGYLNGNKTLEDYQFPGDSDK